jgi:pimeloyl-ACP methyl ester carboxylesterase
LTNEQLHVIERGVGPAVLLIHGMAGSGLAHFGPLLEPLAELGFQLLAPDLRGHGGSRALAPHSGPTLFAAHVADLLGLIERRGLRRCHLIGYSDGGEIALQLAAQLGHRAGSLCIWGVSGRVPPPSVVALYADPARQIAGWPGLRAELEALHGPGGPALLPTWAAAMAALSAQGELVDGGAAERVACPTLIVSGDRDPFNPIAAVRGLAERIPDARLLEMAGAGHDLLAERGPQLIAVLKRFLMHHRATEGAES